MGSGLKKPRTYRAAPHAAMLIESMRDIGYSLGSALADVIDNSIAAHASEIRLLADTSGPEPRVAILDDGEGMTDVTLLDAMRPGSRSPLAARDEGDLGRFGLGLKTASFSQCRKLTVISRHLGKTAAACWDLDFVAKVDDWLVQIPDDPSAVPWAESLGETGTLVLWERLDRIADKDPSREAQQHVVRRLDDAVEHLELVFHRFLAGEKGTRKIKISINGRPLEPHDPFHASHSATIAWPVEHIQVRGYDVVVQAFTLPHHKKVSLQEWDRYAGRAGYTRNQGFYVYRGKRLIIYGTWFGLARQMELTKLARVRIDLPLQLDNDWKIDVRKSSAHPPRHVRERLRRVIETMCQGSRRVYETRGRRLVSESRLPVWHRTQNKNEIRYGINPEHPVIAEFMNELTEVQRRDFVAILELAGAALPVDALFADVGGQPEQVAGDSMSDGAFDQAVAKTCRHLLRNGTSASEIAEMFRATEPFRSAWARTEAVLRGVLEEGRQHE